MHLCPRELEGLLLHQAGFLSQKRLARGIKLNHPETVALIASQIQELVREGYSVSELMSKGRQLLGYNQVMPGVTQLIHEVQVEATFPDGTKLVTVHDPICQADGNLYLALHGSFLPVPDVSVFKQQSEAQVSNSSDTVQCADYTPGELFVDNDVGDIEINAGRRKSLITVTSHCDRPIQVGSHYHFIETNKYLEFNRAAAYGMRLDIAAGTAIRFEPGDTKQVPLVEIAGDKIIHGGNGLCDGPADVQSVADVMQRVTERGFAHSLTAPVTDRGYDHITTIPRLTYAHTYGPTTGDKVRLGDTSLIIEVEKDFTVYGDECKFGGGKVLREGQGQASDVCSDQCIDTVITNALILDAVSGIVKADIGIKDGNIIGIGKAGNPHVMQGVDKNLVVGVSTECIAGEGMIVTAGALDCHVHFICPQLVKEAVASGITTMFGGGTGPATGSKATTCTPGPYHIRNMIQSTDAFPLNFGFTGKGNTSKSEGIARELEEQIEAGAIGLKLHEDWGTTPAAIDCCLRVADEHDVQVTIHTDTLNESSCVEQTVESFRGRTIHTYHSEGAGGGHAPDIMRVCGEVNVIPSSTNPTRPYTTNTIDEHIDMLMVCHHLDKNLKEDVSFAESRIRAETIAAEDILHDLGAISIISSDSQAMGRIGEVITRTWQTADKMKCVRGRLAEEKGNNDNMRAKRYVAKYTINPAISHGMDQYVGSVEVGKMADLVLWTPGMFGAKPDLIIKGGQIAWSQMGMPNASIPTPEPVKQRKMFGAYGKCVQESSVVFVSKCSITRGVIQQYGVGKRAVPVTGCRRVNKRNMVLNDYTPRISVNPQTYQVHISDRDGDQQQQHLTCPPASKLSLAQRYFLF